MNYIHVLFLINLIGLLIKVLIFLEIDIYYTVLG